MRARGNNIDTTSDSEITEESMTVANAEIISDATLPSHEGMEVYVNADEALVENF